MSPEAYAASWRVPVRLMPSVGRPWMFTGAEKTTSAVTSSSTSHASLSPASVTRDTLVMVGGGGTYSTDTRTAVSSTRPSKVQSAPSSSQGPLAASSTVMFSAPDGVTVRSHLLMSHSFGATAVRAPLVTVIESLTSSAPPLIESSKLSCSAKASDPLCSGGASLNSAVRGLGGAPNSRRWGRRP